MSNVSDRTPSPPRVRTLPAHPETSPEAGRPEAGPAWRLANLQGRLTEISEGPAGAALTFALSIAREAQRRGEPAAWITATGETFFPPDAAASGVEIEALAVIRATDETAALRAADHLVRSGGFALMALDLGSRRRLPPAALNRLAGLAQRHATALLFLTRTPPEQPSLGPRISLRVHATRGERVGDGFRCELRAIRDKRHAPGWRHEEVCRGPDGLH